MSRAALLIPPAPHDNPHGARPRRTMKLTSELLVAAYSQGAFPMDVEGRIRWFCPDPRAILPLDTFHIPHSLRPVVRRGTFDIRVNTAFEAVMRGCADREDGTWISRPIIRAYCALHQEGVAHSVEAWKDGELAGGLYGVALGGAFFGESMFHLKRDASKVALVALVQRMMARGYVLLDIQFQNAHLERFGAVEIPRGEYLQRLAAALDLPNEFT